MTISTSEFKFAENVSHLLSMERFGCVESLHLCQKGHGDFEYKTKNTHTHTHNSIGSVWNTKTLWPITQKSSKKYAVIQFMKVLTYFDGLGKRKNLFQG